MDFSLRCNNLPCRTCLTDRATVTTCSHIFCCQCADELGLSTAQSHARICPACKTHLPNPDDAAETTLRPSEEYKTSVLSGLSPAVIIECAGRGLAFYSYQATQEILYQEFLYKSVKNKQTALNGQLEQTINDANSEIATLQNQISILKVECADLQRKNDEVVDAYKERVAAHGRIQKQFDAMKRRILHNDAREAREATADATHFAYPQVPRPSASQIPQSSVHDSPPQSLNSRQLYMHRDSRPLDFSREWSAFSGPDNQHENASHSVTGQHTLKLSINAQDRSSRWHQPSRAGGGHSNRPHVTRMPLVSNHQPIPRHAKIGR